MASEMEKILGLGTIQKQRTIPGTLPVSGREFLYVSEDGSEAFRQTFKAVVWKIDPPIATQGAVVLEGCKIQLPTGVWFHAISYKGDTTGWRRQIEDGARLLNLQIAVL